MDNKIDRNCHEHADGKPGDPHDWLLPRRHGPRNLWARCTPTMTSEPLTEEPLTEEQLRDLRLAGDLHGPEVCDCRDLDLVPDAENACDDFWATVALVARIRAEAVAAKEAELQRIWEVHEQYIADNVDLTQKVCDAEAAQRALVERIEALHRPFYNDYDGHIPRDQHQTCKHDGMSWPCPTIAALAADPSASEKERGLPAVLRREAQRRTEHGYVHHATVRDLMRRLADHMDAMAEFGSGDDSEGGIALDEKNLEID